MILFVVVPRNKGATNPLHTGRFLGFYRKTSAEFEGWLGVDRWPSLMSA